MKHTFLFSLLSAFFIILWNSNIVAQCPDQLTNQSSSIVLSPGSGRSGINSVTGVQIGASCGLRISANVGGTWARYEIAFDVASNALIPGDQIEISMDITNVTANFQYDLRNGSAIIDSSDDPVGRIITIPSGATSLRIRLFTNAGQSDIGGSFDISNLNVSKVGAGSNDTQAPTAPTLSSTGQTETTANLSWSGATDNVGVTGYMVYKDGTLEDTLGNVLSYNVTGLNSNTSYNFTVKALDAAGNESLLSNTATATTSSSADTQDPTAPTLVENGKTDTTVNLSWSGATDNTAVTGYRIFKDGTLETTLANVNTYQVTGLTENTTYSFTATALDAAGNESTGSNAITVTTDVSSGGSGGSNGTVWSETNSVANYSGSVAVGTTVVPSDYKMAIDGKLITEEVKVQISDSWPDYVFEEGYDLPSLSEIQKHIRKKGHLPHIPSAKEVEVNGIELGEMNRLLLEKIEELTLYVIQLKKENERQQEQINKLLNKK